MVIYLEQALAVNWVMDFVLIRLAGRLWNRPPSLLRSGLAALTGAVWMCLSLFRPLSALGGPWASWMVAAIMVCVAFAGLKWQELGRLWVALLGIAFLAAGGCQVFMGLAGGSTRPAASWAILGAGLALLMCGWTLVPADKRLQRRSLVTLRVGGSSFCALIDTGHAATEPISGLPVLVLDGFRAHRILPETLWRSLESGHTPEHGRWIYLDTVQGDGCCPTAYLPLVQVRQHGQWQDLGPMYVMVSPKPLQLGLDALLAPHPRLQEEGRMTKNGMDSNVDGWA